MNEEEEIRELNKYLKSRGLIVFEIGRILRKVYKDIMLDCCIEKHIREIKNDS